MVCGYCGFTDGFVYTSYPPKVMCKYTGKYMDCGHACEVEMAPVRHGLWVIKEFRISDMDKVEVFACSECGAKNFNNKDNYCPNCGAKMDKEN